MNYRRELSKQSKELESFIKYCKPAKSYNHFLVREGLRQFRKIGKLFVEAGVNYAIVNPRWTVDQVKAEGAYLEELAKIRGKFSFEPDYANSIKGVHGCIEGLLWKNDAWAYTLNRLILLRANLDIDIHSEHEFFHVTQQNLLTNDVGESNGLIDQLYKQAKTKGDFVNVRASTDFKEYFAYSAQSVTRPGFFEGKKRLLKRIDPDLYELVCNVLRGEPELFLPKLRDKLPTLSN
jgi:hypothetical protein|tara:strand:- start:94 stop:798 length:705 start_codon:yes stop_codon:yes gene_type:complete